MKRIQALPRALALLAGMFMLTGALAAEPAEEGVDYKRLSKPVPVETGKQIEVAEFFWYGCPHCNQLDPGIKAWAKKLPADVKFRPVPVVLGPDWLPAAKIYYTLAEMGALNRLHGKVFDAYHKEKLNLDDEAQLMAWVKKQKLDTARFKSIYNGFYTHSQSMKGQQSIVTAFSAAGMGRPGVPAVLVDGKYLTNISMTFTEERLFEVLDQLIQRARSERGGKSTQQKPVAPK